MMGKRRRFPSMPVRVQFSFREASALLYASFRLPADFSRRELRALLAARERLDDALAVADGLNRRRLDKKREARLRREQRERRERRR